MTRKVLGDARERDGECQLFLLTAAGSCEVAYPETRSPGWKSASVGRAAPFQATRPSLAREPLKTPEHQVRGGREGARGGPEPPASRPLSVVRVYIRPYHKPQQVSKVNSL